MVVMENRRWSNVKKLAFVCFDVIAMTGSILAAFWLRLGWPFHPRYILFLQTYIVPFIVIKIDIFYFSGMYRRLWRYASIRELRVIVQAVALSSLAILFLSYAVGTLPIPRTVFIVDGLLTLFAVGGIRFLGRTLSELRIYGQASATARRVLLVGAGDAEADKPAAAPVALALAPSGIAGGPRVWMVGDAAIDVECARNAGCLALVVGDLARRTSEFRGWPPDWHGRDLDQLAALARDVARTQIKEGEGGVPGARTLYNGRPRGASRSATRTGRKRRTRGHP